MSDLARQAAAAIAGVPWELSIEATEKIIKQCGVLVSHEDAALLGQVKRMLSALALDGDATEVDTPYSWAIRNTGTPETPMKVIFETLGAGCESKCYVAIVKKGDTLTAALSSALDEAGVPKAEVPS
jgi:hypothetical protein